MAVPEQHKEQTPEQGQSSEGVNVAKKDLDRPAIITRAVARLHEHWTFVTMMSLLIFVSVLVFSVPVIVALVSFVVLFASIMAWPMSSERDAKEAIEKRTLKELIEPTPPVYKDATLPADANVPPKALWKALVQALPDAAVVLDKTTRILRYNQAALELFPSIQTGLLVSRVTRNPELIDAVDRASGQAEPIVVQIFERLPVERRISATVSKLIHDDEGRLAPDLLICFRDHTEQDRLEKMRSDFVANASHELRTPLSSLRGLVDTLKGPARNDPAARERFLNVMASQAERMTRLIDDLLSLSRVEMRAHLPPRGSVELNAVANEVVLALEPLAEASTIKLSLHGSEEPQTIRGDRDEIVQVLQNLVHNAIKYGREGGHIDVRIETSQQTTSGNRPQEVVKIVTVVVEDDGVGIAAHHLPRLTERFYRANVASSREKGGTGLGLAIVKHIVARHRAVMRIESELDRGSKFSVSFEVA